MSSQFFFEDILLQFFILISLFDIIIKTDKPKHPKFCLYLIKNLPLLKQQVTSCPLKYSNLLFLQNFHFAK